MKEMRSTRHTPLSERSKRLRTRSSPKSHGNRSLSEESLKSTRSRNLTTMEARQADRKRKRKTPSGHSSKQSSSKKRDFDNSDSTDINTSDETDNEESSDQTRPSVPRRNSESNANMMDLIALESRIHEQISNTVRVIYQGPGTMAMDKIRKIPTLHPQMESSKIARIFLSYFYILKFDSPRACQEYMSHVAQNEPEKEVTLYCATCAFNRPGMLDAHRTKECKSGAKGDLNRICKLSYANFIDCTSLNTDAVLLVRQVKPVEVHELEALMAQNPNITNIMSDKVFYIEAVTNSYAKFLVKLLNGCEKHRFGDSACLGAQLFPTACGSFTNFNDVSMIRHTSPMEERKRLCQKLQQIDLTKGTNRDHCLIILGSVVKSMTKLLFRDYVKRIMGSKCTAVLCHTSTSKIRRNSDYDAFCLALFKSPEDAQYAIKVAQFHHLMGHHVNINLLNVFMNMSIEVQKSGTKLTSSKPSIAIDGPSSHAERVTERLNMEFQGRQSKERKQSISRKRPHESPNGLDKLCPSKQLPSNKDDMDQTNPVVPIATSTSTSVAQKYPIQALDLTSSFNDTPLTISEPIPPPLVSDNCVQQDPLEQIRTKSFADVPPLIKSATLATCSFCFKHDSTLKTIKELGLCSGEVEKLQKVLHENEKTSLIMHSSSEMCSTCSKFVGMLCKKELALSESLRTHQLVQQDLKTEKELKLRVFQTIKDDHSKEVKALKDDLVSALANSTASELALNTLKEEVQKQKKISASPLFPEFTIKLKKLDESVLNPRDLALLRRPKEPKPSAGGPKEKGYKRDLANARAELNSMKDSLKIVKSEADEKDKEIARLKADLEKRNQIKEERNFANFKSTIDPEERLKHLKKRLQDEMRAKIENIKKFDQTLRGQKEALESMERSQKAKDEEIEKLKGSLAESMKINEESKKAVDDLTQKQGEVQSFLLELGSDSLASAKETFQKNAKAKEAMESRFQAVSKAATENQTQISSLNSQIEQQNRKVISLQRSSNEHQSIVNRMISIISAVGNGPELEKEKGLSESLKALEIYVEEAMKKLGDLQTELEKSQSLNTDLDKRLQLAEEVKKDLAQLQNVRKELEEALQKKGSEVQELQTQMQSLKVALDEAKTQRGVDQAKESVNENKRMKLEKEVNSLKGILTKTDKDNLKAKSQLNEAQSELREAKQNLALNQGRLTSLQKEVDEGNNLKVKYRQKVNELQEAQKELARVRGQSDPQTQLILTLKGRIRELADELNNANQNIHDLEITVRTLHNMTKQPAPKPSSTPQDYGLTRPLLHDGTPRPQMTDRRASYEDFPAVTSSAPTRTSMPRVEQQNFPQTSPRPQTQTTQPTQPTATNPPQRGRMQSSDPHWVQNLSPEDRAICRDIRLGVIGAFDELTGKLDGISREAKQGIFDSLYNNVTQVDPRFLKKTHLVRMVLNDVIFENNPPTPVQRVSQQAPGPSRSEPPKMSNAMMNAPPTTNRLRPIRPRTDLFHSPTISAVLQQ
ncbi:hypothetical protein TCAL_12277, partial [Tigriopus californicus]